MKIHATTKFIIGIIIIAIIIMIFSYIFKIIEAGSNKLGDTLHLWIIQVPCIWGTSFT